MMRYISILSVILLLFGCRERLMLLYSVANENHIVKFRAVPEWQMEWNARIVQELESGRLAGYNEKNEILSPDSIKLGRELTQYSRFEYEQPVITEFSPDQMVGGWQPEERRYIDLMFFNPETGFYQFYSRIRLDDLEQLVDRQIRFAETPFRTVVEV